MICSPWSEPVRLVEICCVKYPPETLLEATLSFRPTYRFHPWESWPNLEPKYPTPTETGALNLWLISVEKLLKWTSFTIRFRSKILYILLIILIKYFKSPQLYWLLVAPLLMLDSSGCVTHTFLLAKQIHYFKPLAVTGFSQIILCWKANANRK